MHEPLVIENADGGRAVFLDTGAAKGGRTLDLDHFAASAEALKKELERALLRLCCLLADTFSRTLFTS